MISPNAKCCEIIKQIKAKNPNILLIQLCSTEEAQLIVEASPFFNSTNGISSRRIRLMTNRFREYDGRDLAGENAVKWFKSQFKRSAALLYTTDITRVSASLNKLDDKIYISSDEKFALNFAMFTQHIGEDEKKEKKRWFT